MHLYGRLSVMLLLLGVLFVLGIHYGATFDANWPHPTGDQLGEEPNAWDGDTGLLIGEVRDAESSSGTYDLVIEDRAEEEVTRMTVVDGTQPVSEGGTVQVIGDLDMSTHTIDPERVVVVDRDPGDRRYKLIASVFGVVLAAGTFLRSWRIEWRACRFVPRGKP